ncbi:hypothetical protein ACOME3_007929 [Neoechinorhynchus agilis]
MTLRHLYDFPIVSNPFDPRGSDRRQEEIIQAGEHSSQFRHSQTDLFHQHNTYHRSNSSNWPHYRLSQSQQNLHHITHSFVDSSRYPHALDRNLYHHSLLRSQRLVNRPSGFSLNPHSRRHQYLITQRLTSQLPYLQNRHPINLSQEQSNEHSSNYHLRRMPQFCALPGQTELPTTRFLHAVEPMQINPIQNMQSGSLDLITDYSLPNAQSIPNRTPRSNNFSLSGELSMHEYHDIDARIPRRRHSVEPVQNPECGHRVYREQANIRDVTVTSARLRQIQLVNEERMRRRCLFLEPINESEVQIEDNSRLSLPAVPQEYPQFQITIYNTIAVFHIFEELNIRELANKVMNSKIDSQGRILTLIHHAPPGKVSFYRFDRAVIYCPGTLDQTRDLADRATRQLRRAGVKHKFEAIVFAGYKRRPIFGFKLIYTA